MRHITLGVRGKVFDLTDEPAVMGILNHTPDSFYPGSRIQGREKIYARIEQIIAEGAKIIDVGGYSSRPGADEVPEDEEWRRVSEVLNAIREVDKEIVVSVDTFRSSVARRSVEEGDADIINDVSAGLLDAEMFGTVAELGAPYLLMHMRGTPKTMHHLHDYKGRVVEGALPELLDRLKLAKEAGVRDENVILDPGFGFSKNAEQNFELLTDLDKFLALEYPVLVGVSRKAFIYKPFGVGPDEALNGTTVVNTYALMQGAHILRVHDVRPAVETVRIVCQLKKYAAEVAHPTHSEEPVHS